MTVPQATRPSINSCLLRDAAQHASATVTAVDAGVVAGLTESLEHMDDELSACVRWHVSDGTRVAAGQTIGAAVGSAIQLNRIEDNLLGVVGVASGIATRAASIAASAPGLRIVCGAWKKLPSALKPALRAGLDAADVGHRLLAEEFVYVDKNSVVLLGGVSRAVRAGLAVGNGPVAVQLKHPDECTPAVDAGASVLMVDTGRLSDLHDVRRQLDTRPGCQVRLAFGGGVRTSDLPAIAAAGATIVDIGREILDAPLLDLRFDVDPTQEGP